MIMFQSACDDNLWLLDFNYLEHLDIFTEPEADNLLFWVMSSVAVLLLSSKLGLTMTLPKKFAVVKLKEVSESSQNPYKCVPKTWLKFGNLNDVMLPYPTAEELPLSINLIIDYASPLITWPSYEATYVCELGEWYTLIKCFLTSGSTSRLLKLANGFVLDTYEECLFLITRMDDNLPEEFAIMTWKKLSRELRERQIRQQPNSVLYQLWEWFSSCLYQ